MPELPEVETTLRGLNILIGLKVIKVHVTTKKLRYTIPNTIFKIEKNSKVAKVERIAKYILIHFDSGYSIVIHLGMSGRLKIINKSNKTYKHDHFLLKLNKSKTLVFNDARKFGFIDVDKSLIIYKRRYITSLGIDALSLKLNSKYLIKKIGKSEVPIKQILLNQKILSGIGNIYASEILFDAKISPFVKGRLLKTKQMNSLIKSIRKILKKAIKLGGSSIRDYSSSEGTLGNFQSKFFVYNQEGKTISKYKVKKVVQYGRSTYYCPGLQKEQNSN